MDSKKECTEKCVELNPLNKLPCKSRGYVTLQDKNHYSLANQDQAEVISLTGEHGKEGCVGYEQKVVE